MKNILLIATMLLTFGAVNAQKICSKTGYDTKFTWRDNQLCKNTGYDVVLTIRSSQVCKKFK